MKYRGCQGRVCDCLDQQFARWFVVSISDKGSPREGLAAGPRVCSHDAHRPKKIVATAGADVFKKLRDLVTASEATKSSRTLDRVGSTKTHPVLRVTPPWCLRLVASRAAISPIVETSRRSTSGPSASANDLKYSIATEQRRLMPVAYATSFAMSVCPRSTPSTPRKDPGSHLHDNSKIFNWSDRDLASWPTVGHRDDLFGPLHLDGIALLRLV